MGFTFRSTALDLWIEASLADVTASDSLISGGDEASTNFLQPRCMQRKKTAKSRDSAVPVHQVFTIKHDWPGACCGSVPVDQESTPVGRRLDREVWAVNV